MKASVCLFVERDSLVDWVVGECKADNILAWSQECLVRYSPLQQGQHDEARYIHYCA
jgi:hypothetical protein